MVLDGISFSLFPLTFTGWRVDSGLFVSRENILPSRGLWFKTGQDNPDVIRTWPERVKAMSSAPSPFWMILSPHWYPSNILSMSLSGRVYERKNPKNPSFLKFSIEFLCLRCEIKTYSQNWKLDTILKRRFSPKNYLIVRKISEIHSFYSRMQRLFVKYYLILTYLIISFDCM